MKLIKPAEKTLSLSDLPSNWRDHIEVVTRRRSKVRVQTELTDEYLDPFEALASSRRIVPLDDMHNAIIDELTHSGFSTIWVPDHHLLQTHTKALAKLMEEKGKELNLKGIFQTISEGSNPGSPNCFMFPLDNGGWRVFRFSPGVSEAETWTQDKEGWTNCCFNCKPNLLTASRAMGAQEDPDQGGYVFDEASKAVEAAEALGQKIELPVDLEGHEAKLKSHADGRLIMEINKTSEETSKRLAGWLNKSDRWVKLFDVPTVQKHETIERDRDERVTIPIITSAELDQNSYQVKYLIPEVLVEGQPCLIAGSEKSLKTSITIDLAIALAAGVPFLGEFAAGEPCPTAVLSGESGLSTIRDTAKAIYQARGVSLADLDTLVWSDFLPQATSHPHLDALHRMLDERKPKVLILDPSYLSIPVKASEAGNLHAQGALLRRINDVCKAQGVTLALVHHTRKRPKTGSRYEPATLSDASWSGYAEFARQWLLISRQKEYEPGTGQHALWLCVGGSAGHSSLWGLDIDEGVPGAKQWQVTLSSPDEARANKKAGSIRQRILDAASAFPSGETKTVILTTAKARPDAKTRAIFDSLVNEGLLIHQEVKKRAATYSGFRLAS
ncbi:MAG: AAA family ATPase [Pirellulales bacterium]|nr:AAA family ATPase [Pirellulales bacterium]